MTHFFRNLPIKHKLIALTMAISGLALLLACTVFALYEQAGFRRTLARDSAILARMFGGNVASGLAFNDAASIEVTLSALSANRRIAAACVYDKQGVITGTYRRAGPAGDRAIPFPAAGPTGQNYYPDRIDTLQDITLAGEVIGGIYISTELSELRERAWRYVGIVILLLLGCSLVAWGFAARLQRLISRPILDLVQTVATIARDKNYTVRAAKLGEDELGQLINGFNEMLNQIQVRDTELEGSRRELEARVAERTKELAKSLSLLTATLESTTDGIVAVDLAGRAVSHNSRFSALWQFPPGLLARRDAAEMRAHTATQVKDSAAFLLLAQEQPGPKAAEKFDVVELKDGRTFERYVFPQLIEGRCVGTVISWRDITARKRAEEVLHASEARMRLQTAALESAANGVAITDPAGTILWVNPAFTLLTGYTAHDAVGLNPRLLKSGLQPETFYHELWSTITAGRVWKGELINRRKDGQTYAEEMTITPVRDAQGTILNFVAIKQDISVRRRTDEELRSKTALLEAQLDSTLDGILIVDNAGKKIIQNKRLAVLWKIPDEVARDPDDNRQIQFVMSRARYPDQFVEKVRYLYAHPAESSHEETEFIDGTVLERYSAPVNGRDGKHYGRIWLFRDITERKRAEAELAKTHQELVEASRLAGMAEVATGVLHNVGNVLNSVNVSATIIADRLQRSEAGNIAKLATLFDQHQPALAAFLTTDARGRLVPGYLGTLAAALVTERASIFAELDQLRKNIDHIKEIVAVQQSYARSSGLIESVAVAEIVDDALRMNAGSFLTHGIETIRDYQAQPTVSTDKHKVMQILINLVRNAKYACDDAGRPDKRITLRTRSDARRFTIAVIDNGIGIPAENLTRIFNHGFTTRKDGHGFGLHSGALAARELGGSLSVSSAGPGQGATFTLDLPCQPEPPAHEDHPH